MGEPRSYMLFENSTAAAFEPGESVEKEWRAETITYNGKIINPILKTEMQLQFQTKSWGVLPVNLQEQLEWSFKYEERII